MDALIGRTFDGYKLIERVGTDGTASIYKGFENKLSRWAVVKVIPFEAGRGVGEGNLPASFRLHAQAIAALRHCNISLIYGYGVAQGWAYIIIEYVAGSLKDRLDPHRPFTWNRALDIIVPISQALAFAHDQNIIHGEVKPSNILMPREDWPLLSVDFGLIRMLNRKASYNKGEILRDPMIDEEWVGPLNYAAPEEIQGDEIDARANIYSLGIILYELLSGKLPSEGETSFEFILARLTKPPRSILEANPDVPAVFGPILDKALAQNPDDRYQTMVEFSQNLINARYELRRSMEAPDHSAGQDVSADMVGTHQPESMNVILKITRTGQEFSIGNQAELTVGRAKNSEIPTIDLTPHGGRQAGVSRRHSRLLRKDDQWFVEDLNSTNGTYVNGAKIPPHQITPVHQGDLLRFGEIELEFGLG